MTRQSVLLFFVAYFLISLPGSTQDGNSLPQVRITTSGQNRSATSGAQVYYSIDVKDKEDGFSEYDEINGAEVFVKIEYLEKAAGTVTYDKEKSNPLPSGLKHAIKSSCLACHQVKGALIGPSFAEVSRKYSKQPTIKEELVNRVIKGSTGNWGEQIMPPHPETSEKVIREIIDWALSMADDPNINYLSGLSGSFQTTKKGDYVLTAFYIDHGTEQRPFSGEPGTDRVIIKVE